MVVYPGWWINGSSTGKDVWVLNEKCLPGFLAHEDEHLTEEQINTLAAQLARYSREGLRPVQ